VSWRNGPTALLATILHGMEGGIWVAAHRFPGAYLTIGRYSLSANDKLRDATLSLEIQWHLMGALALSRHDAVWADHRLSVRHDSKGSGRSAAGMAPGGLRPSV
jgi:hypothetical protein